MKRYVARLAKALLAYAEPQAGTRAARGSGRLSADGSSESTDSGAARAVVRSDGGPESIDSGERRAVARPDGGSSSKDGEVRPAVKSDGGRPNDGGIKMVVAVVRPDRLAQVKTALAEIGAPSLTVTNVSGRGSQPAKTGQWRGEEYTVDLHQKVKIECIVADIPAENVVGAIREAANTGEPGDGKIFVLPVENAVQVRTGNEGVEAV